jgi:hypothetical protein
VSERLAEMIYREARAIASGHGRNAAATERASVRVGRTPRCGVVLAVALIRTATDVGGCARRRTSDVQCARKAVPRE